MNLFTTLYSSLDIDRDIKFALLDNPNKLPLQFWPYELVTKQGSQEKRTVGPQHLERYQFLTYFMIQKGLYCRFCFCFAKLEEIKKAGGSAEIQLVNKLFKKFARLSNYLEPHQKTAHQKKSLGKAQAFLDSVKNPNRNIDVKLDLAVAKEMEKNRKFLAPIVSTIVFTARLFNFVHFLIVNKSLFSSKLFSIRPPPQENLRSAPDYK